MGNESSAEVQTSPTERLAEHTNSFLDNFLNPVEKNQPTDPDALFRDLGSIYHIHRTVPELNVAWPDFAKLIKGRPDLIGDAQTILVQKVNAALPAQEQELLEMIRDLDYVSADDNKVFDGKAVMSQSDWDEKMNRLKSEETVVEPAAPPAESAPATAAASPEAKRMAGGFTTERQDNLKQGLGIAFSGSFGSEAGQGQHNWVAGGYPQTGDLATLMSDNPSQELAYSFQVATRNRIMADQSGQNWQPTDEKEIAAFLENQPDRPKGAAIVRVIQDNGQRVALIGFGSGCAIYLNHGQMLDYETIQTPQDPDTSGAEMVLSRRVTLNPNDQLIITSANITPEGMGRIRDRIRTEVGPIDTDHLDRYQGYQFMEQINQYMDSVLDQEGQNDYARLTVNADTNPQELALPSPSGMLLPSAPDDEPAASGSLPRLTPPAPVAPVPLPVHSQSKGLFGWLKHIVGLDGPPSHFSTISEGLDKPRPVPPPRPVPTPPAMRVRVPGSPDLIATLVTAPAEGDQPTDRLTSEQTQTLQAEFEGDLEGLPPDQADRLLQMSRRLVMGYNNDLGMDDNSAPFVRALMALTNNLGPLWDDKPELSQLPMALANNQVGREALMKQLPVLIEKAAPGSKDYPIKAARRLGLDQDPEIARQLDALQTTITEAAPAFPPFFLVRANSIRNIADNVETQTALSLDQAGLKTMVGKGLDAVADQRYGLPISKRIEIIGQINHTFELFNELANGANNTPQAAAAFIDAVVTLTQSGPVVEDPRLKKLLTTIGNSELLKNAAADELSRRNHGQPSATTQP